MKFGHLIEYNKRKFLFQNHAENERGRLFPELYLFFKEALGKSNWSTA